MISKDSRGFSLIETLMVVALIGVLAAIAVPMSGNTIKFLKLSGDARDLANLTAVAKMRAAASSRSRGSTLTWSAGPSTFRPADKATSAWVTEGGANPLSSTVTFSYGPVATPPPNTQTTIGQAPACLNNAAVAHREYGLHHLQFPRYPGGHHRQPDWAGAIYVTDGNRRLRDHRRGDRLHPHLADELHVDADMDAAMIARLRGEEGTSILEVVIASAILVTLMAGLMSLVGLAISTTENQGHLAARTTEYAQDKMEQLMALTYDDSTSDTRTFPAATAGGTGLAVGGSSNTNAPVAALCRLPRRQRQPVRDDRGRLCRAGRHDTANRLVLPALLAGDAVPSANLKQVTVTATIARGFGGAMKASSTLTVLKSKPLLSHAHPLLAGGLLAASNCWSR